MQWYHQLNRSGYLHEDKLSKKLRYYLTPMCKFRQFCDITEALGKNSGDTVDFRKVMNLHTGANVMGLREVDLMPETYYNVKTDVVCVKEYGIGVPFTGKAKVLSRWDVEDIIRKLLARDASNTIDSVVELEFDQTLIRYVGQTAATGTFFRNGYAGVANGTGMYPFHVKEIIDELRSREVPTYDGTDYVCLGTTHALRNLKDQLEGVQMYTVPGRKPVLAGEVGRYYGCRFVEVNHAMDATNFALGHSSEAYFFGSDTVMEAIAVPEEVRVKETSDYKRRQGLAWYAILGFKLQWGDRRNADSDWHQTRIIKWDSATGTNSSSASTYSRSYDSFPSHSESLGWCISTG
jgi:N4-gp56 family major capsid protein